MPDLPQFAYEQSPFGPVLAATNVPSGVAAVFTGASFEGRLSSGIAESISGWLAERFGIHAPLSTCHQVHGVTTRRVAAASDWREQESCDALWSDEDRSVLAIKVADCVAVLMVDRESGVSLAFHAGWRGTAAGVATESIAAARLEGDFDPARALVWIGPSIRACCFEVGDEVVEALSARRTLGAEVVDRTRGDRPYLDLTAIVIDDLVGAGIPREAISDAAICTQCTDAFHSYRRDAGAGGRNLAMIAVDRARMGQT